MRKCVITVVLDRNVLTGKWHWDIEISWGFLEIRLMENCFLSGFECIVFWCEMWLKRPVFFSWRFFNHSWFSRNFRGSFNAADTEKGTWKVNKFSKTQQYNAFLDWNRDNIWLLCRDFSKPYGYGLLVLLRRRDCGITVDDLRMDDSPEHRVTGALVFGYC